MIELFQALHWLYQIGIICAIIILLFRIGVSDVIIIGVAMVYPIAAAWTSFAIIGIAFGCWLGISASLIYLLINLVF